MALVNYSKERIGEVIAANTRSCEVQCYHLYNAPPLGTFIRAGDPPIYAVVMEVSTEALDPGRPIIARGQNEANEEDIYRNNPQLDRLLSTRLTGLIIGFTQDKKLCPGLAPLPPRIHSFVYPCSAPEIIALTDSSIFLNLLLHGGAPSPDEVIVASLRIAMEHVNGDDDFLVRIGKILALELWGELPRLNAILRRLS